MKNIVQALVLCIASCALLTCAEHPEINPNPNPPVVPGATLTIEQRIAVMHEARDFSKLVGDLKTDPARQALLAWLKVHPAFADAGITGTTVWADFYDGRMVMFVPDWMGADATGGRIAFNPLADQSKEHVQGRSEKTPGNIKATLFFGLGKRYKDDTGYLKDMFEQSKAGYNVDIQKASVENLMKAKDIGLFHINTHDGMGKTLFNIRPDMYALWTTDTLSPAFEQKYPELLESNKLVLMCAPHDYSSELHYGITNRFVKEYISLANDAFIYVDACSSLKPGVADSLVLSMMDAAANGKSTYVGWTDDTSGTEGRPTTRYAFDRLLAVHDPSVQPGIIPQQRPFDWPSVYKDLIKDGYGVSVYKGKLNYRSIYTSPVILRPSTFLWTTLIARWLYTACLVKIRVLVAEKSR